MKDLQQKMIERHAPNLFEKLQNAKVAIAGLGGLGSNIAVSLARLGVGKLLLIDFDVVEPSNLNRQSYTVKHLGMKKTQALKSQLEDINPFIQIEVKDCYITAENVVDLLEGYEIVCEAFDKPENKAILINTLREYLPDTKIVSGSGMGGYVSSNLIQTRSSLKNLYVCGDLVTEATKENGVMSPRVMICAGHQANMILRLIAGEEQA